MHFSQSKSTKCEIFGCLLHSPKPKNENISICIGKKCTKRLENLHIKVFGYVHYVQTLSDMYFLSYDGFSWFLTGRLRHRVRKHSGRGRIRSKEDCCIGPILFWWFLTPFYATCLLQFGFFQETLIVETQNLHHWIWHASSPKYAPINLFSMHLSQSKSTKCEIFGCLLHSPWQKNEKSQIVQGKSVQKGLKICTYRFLSMPITMHYVRTLSDKYFLSYDGFTWFLTGRLRHRVQKHSVGVESDPRRIAA